MGNHAAEGVGGGVAAEYFRLLRPAQWTKNVLVFVPLILSHHIADPRLVGRAMLAVVVMSLIASAGYILNDILDRHADRLHRVKRLRPVAAGSVSIAGASVAALVLVALSVVLATQFPRNFGLTVFTYLALATAYSAFLKEISLVDALTLGALYDIRVFAGAAATGVIITAPTLAFLLFLCFSIALAKRCAELRGQPDSGRDTPMRRGYQYQDAALLQTMGTSSGYLAVVVLAFYISSPEAHRVYSHPELLWLLCPVLLYWISRVWLLLGRDELSEDPIMFALRDAPTYAAGVAGALILYLAA